MTTGRPIAAPTSSSQRRPTENPPPAVAPPPSNRPAGEYPTKHHAPASLSGTVVTTGEQHRCCHLFSPAPPLGASLFSSRQSNRSSHHKLPPFPAITSSPELMTGEALNETPLRVFLVGGWIEEHWACDLWGVLAALV
ncbi:hypothetical protein FXO37_31090 [Capsicum annuum]|nr:hypothetical protein FXO37_31090 [Capsicum annuum]